MPRLPRMFMLPMLALFLGGCVLALPGSKAGTGAAPSPITGDAIEVTALDALPASAEAAAPGKAENPKEAGAKLSQAAAPAQDAKAVPAPTTPVAGSEPVAAKAAIAVVPKSPIQITCEKKGGTWTALGKTSVRTCVRRTRDGGKRCTNENQCDGQCLARSGTCSPIDPLLGCNEVLQINGARVTLCIE